MSNPTDIVRGMHEGSKIKQIRQRKSVMEPSSEGDIPLNTRRQIRPLSVSDRSLIKTEHSQSLNDLRSKLPLVSQIPPVIREEPDGDTHLNGFDANASLSVRIPGEESKLSPYEGSTEIEAPPPEKTLGGAEENVHTFQASDLLGPDDDGDLYERTRVFEYDEDGNLVEVFDDDLMSGEGEPDEDYDYDEEYIEVVYEGDDDDDDFDENEIHIVMEEPDMQDEIASHITWL